MTYDVGNPGPGFGQAWKCKIGLTNQIYLLQYVNKNKALFS